MTVVEGAQGSMGREVGSARLAGGAGRWDRTRKPDGCEGEEKTEARADGRARSVIQSTRHGERKGGSRQGLQKPWVPGVLPHLESAGWRLTAALRRMWGESSGDLVVGADEGDGALSSSAELDLNSGALVAHVAGGLQHFSISMKRADRGLRAGPYLRRKGSKVAILANGRRVWEAPKGVGWVE
eukprot:6187803-Pleurochrysis_carterae.AAC.1